MGLRPARGWRVPLSKVIVQVVQFCHGSRTRQLPAVGQKAGQPQDLRSYAGEEAVW